ncbi:MAG TPA: 2-phosphosulfolactate phosphatase [Solirubrobacteraceae bacterium]|nr:2-phosphosulfolactate phosphatase [Solirubrobacteraceae bacterium]
MIDVTFTGAGVRRADVAVVIDVLRATSTVTQALAGGYEKVICVESIERAQTLRGPGRVLAGERHCIKPAGFDQGNSPLEAIDRRGRELVLATTNGAPTIVAAARHAATVLLACMLNLEAVVGALLASHDPSSRAVQIVCSGTDGALALEDTYLAGRLCAALPGPRTDATKAAEAVARAYAQPLDALEQGADAAVLREVGLEADIAYCARESTLATVPRVCAASDGIAEVGLAGRLTPHS